MPDFWRMVIGKISQNGPCVFFTAPDGRLTAAAIDALTDGLSRRPIAPAGLSGWSWGELCLDSVTVRPCDILGQPGE